MKLVINTCYGGFSVSEDGIARYLEITGIKPSKNFYNRDIPRNDPALVQVVEEMGADADGRCAELKVVDIPDDVEWQIEEYDGIEWVAEKHRTWR